MAVMTRKCCNSNTSKNSYFNFTLDINDNKPQFSQQTYEINIQENQEAGVLIGKVSQPF